MNFFTLDNDDKTQKLQWKTHPKIWIFFGCTIPITILGLFFMNANLLTYIPALVRGMFSRRKTPDPETIDLNNLLEEIRNGQEGFEELSGSLGVRLCVRCIKNIYLGAFPFLEGLDSIIILGGKPIAISFLISGP